MQCVSIAVLPSAMETCESFRRLPGPSDANAGHRRRSGRRSLCLFLRNVATVAACLTARGEAYMEGIPLYAAIRSITSQVHLRFRPPADRQSRHVLGLFLFFSLIVYASNNGTGLSQCLLLPYGLVVARIIAVQPLCLFFSTSIRDELDGL